ncbi:hypothetical protein [Anaerosinus massiliensis]|uniref:hypothetical protein n=1 Tax=Massilibacillus massiliensis TaxID=1806837 RepID=UPI0018FE9130|nr:hypothetical protein [Massilibacillus massiliensis]
MAIGTISTAVIAAVIGFVFILGMKKIIRKFTKGESDCCTTSSCGSCNCHCSETTKDKN